MPIGNLSIRRCVARIDLTPTADATPTLPFPLAVLTFVVTMWADQARGPHTLTIQPEGPTDDPIPAETIEVNFGDADEMEGVDVITRMGLMAEHVGMYWFSVSVSREGGAEHLLTRIPLELYREDQG
jgi:hypothetical protein